jgi:hypothetical protein
MDINLYVEETAFVLPSIIPIVPSRYCPSINNTVAIYSIANSDEILHDELGLIHRLHNVFCLQVGITDELQRKLVFIQPAITIVSTNHLF